jgi:hypothetical protein
MPSLPSGGQVYVENLPRRDSMRFKLIIATVKTDVTDSIVDAAKAAGATGATGYSLARYGYS